MAITRDNSPEPHDDHDPKIFTVNERAVSFYLYGTKEPGSAWALTEGQLEELEGLITQHGGYLCKSPANADTIIVNHVGLDQLRSKYSFDRNLYVELPSFVRRCISTGRYSHEPVQKRPLGGVHPGRRTEFTAEDDMNLCKFIAFHMPHKEAGGRTGNKPYEELCEKAQYDDLPYQWAKRHPPQSWRERYKKHWERFDVIIDDLVKKNPPPADGKGVRPYDRRVNHQGVLARAFMEAQREEEEEEEWEGGGGQEGGEGEPEVDEQGGHIPEPPAPQQPRGARHTDAGARRSSPVEQPRGRVRPQSEAARGRAPSPEDPRELGGEFSEELMRFEDDEEGDDYRPGPNEAGPSGTQHTPESSPPPPKPAQMPGPNVQDPPLVPLLAAGARAAQKVREQQAPKSSQATLVNPSQPPNGHPGARRPSARPREASVEREAAAAPKRKRRKVQPPPPPPAVVPEPLRESGRKTRSALQMARKTASGPRDAPARRRSPAARPQSEQAAQDDEDEDEDEDEEADKAEDEDEEVDKAEDDDEEDDEAAVPNHKAHSHAGATLEEEQDVEDLLQPEEPEGADNSREPSPAAEPGPSASDELDSDDQVSRAKLQPNQRRPSRLRDVSLSDDDDDEAFADTLDLTRPSRSREFPEAGPSRSSVRSPITPVRVVRTGTEGSTESLEGVPLPGTRASQEKNRARESARLKPYSPPPGTRAAGARSQGTFKTLRSGRVLAEA